MNAAIVCDGKELETYGVKQEGTSTLTAFIASEAGKQFKITYSNELTNFDFEILVHIDGRLVQSRFLRAKSSSEFSGLYKSASSILPVKFQELQLVDLDLEDVPVAPEMGMIELQVYRCQKRGTTESTQRFTKEDLHTGCVSERTKKGGWHHVATGEEIPVKPLSNTKIVVHHLDSKSSQPYASIKVFYRPRELLRAQGIIPANDVGRQELQTSKKRAREDGSPGPSRRRQNIKVKNEELSGDVQEQRIRALQTELDALKAASRSRRSIKCEQRSPSPIVARHSGKVIVDLTLED